MDATLALKAVVVAVVEGVTEFLPISSTGHIVVTERLLDHDFGEVFNVVIQFGAILAVCVYYHRRILALLASLATDPASRRFAFNLFLGFIPIAVVGLLIKKHLEDLWRLDVIALTTFFGGIAILLIERYCTKSRHLTAAAMPWTTALGIGIIQIAALLPGTSRSGSSIMGARVLGVDRAAAAEFSFFLAIPLMTAASAKELWDQHKEAQAAGGLGALAHHDDGLGILLLGTGVSFVVALAVVHLLMRFIANHSFAVFGWYRVAAGLALFVVVKMELLANVVTNH